MGGKSSAPPPPDYSGIAAASEASAKYSYELGKEQLAWAKEQYASDRAFVEPILASFLKTQENADRNAALDRFRYETTFQPLEDQLATDALTYASDERRDYEMGRAGAAVAQQFDQGMQAHIQQLESFGVDPSTARAGQSMLGYRAAKGAAEAAAMNQAGQTVDATGRALRSEAINVGRGYPGQVVNSYGLGLQAGSQAVGNNLATTASGANTMGTGLQWQGAGNQALGVWGNALTQGYNAQMAQYNANQNSSSGIGSLLGAGLGLAMRIPSLAEGGMVPVEASPTRGQAIDDVPARLTPGEFVLPKDVMDWIGEKGGQAIIDKARKEAQQATAKPEMRPAIPAPPTFVSRPPAPNAIPVG